jgi:tetratricopeptide (TPR) repeat protein
MVVLAVLGGKIMRISILRLEAFFVIGSLLASPAVAQEEWIGKEFMPREGAKFMIGEREVPFDDIKLPLKVTKVNGEWLWVGKAWVQNGQVIALDEAEAYYDNYLRRNRRSAWAYHLRAMSHGYGNPDGFFASDLKDLNEAIRLSPNMARFYKDRAVVQSEINSDLGFFALFSDEKDPLKEEEERVIADYSTAIRLKPDDADAYLGRGKAYGLRNDYDRAIADFGEAIRLEPQNVDARFARADLWWMKDEWAKLIEECDAILSMDDAQWRAYLLRGRAYARRGEVDPAMADLTRALEFDARDWKSDIHFERGRLWRKKGDVDRAIADFDEAIRLAPDVSPYYMARAEGREVKAKLMAALATSGLVGIAKPTIEEAAAELAGALADRTFLPVSKYDDTKANVGDREVSALQLKLPLVADEIGDGDLLRIGGATISAYHVKPFATAEKEYSRVVREFPDRASGFLLRGIARTAQGNLDGAFADFEEARKREPRNGLVYLYRGIAWGVKGEREKAIADLNIAILRQPDHAPSYLARASARVDGGAFDLALPDLNDAIRLDPSLADAYPLRAMCWFSKNEWEKAVADCDHAMGLKSKSAELFARFIRGTARVQQGDHDGGIEDLNEMMWLADLEPSMGAPARFSRGQAWLAKGEFDKAISDLDKALELGQKTKMDGLVAEIEKTRAEAAAKKGAGENGRSASAAARTERGAPRPPSGPAPGQVPASGGETAEPEVAISGRIEPATIRPGETARLYLTAKPAEGWYIIDYADRRNSGTGSPPTLIAFETTWGLAAGRPSTNAKTALMDEGPNLPATRRYVADATWTIELAAPVDAQPGSYPIVGLIGFMASTDRFCKLPEALRFRATLNVVDQSQDETLGAVSGNSIPLTFAPATYREAEAVAERQTALREIGDAAPESVAEVAPADIPPAPAPPSRGLELLEQALAASKAAKWNEALNLYTRTIESVDLPTPDLAEAYYKRGSTHGHLGNVIEGIRDFTKCIELDANHFEAHSLRGYLRGVVGQYEEAEADHVAAVGLASDQSWEHADAFAMDRYADLLRRQRKFDEALDLCETALEMSDFPVIHFRKAWIHLDRGDLDDARADFERFEEAMRRVNISLDSLWPDERGAARRLRELREERAETLPAAPATEKRPAGRR